jgi:hypothetical protein
LIAGCARHFTSSCSVNARALAWAKAPSLLGIRGEYVKFESNADVLIFIQVIAETASAFAALFILFLLKTTSTD